MEEVKVNIDRFAEYAKKHGGFFNIFKEVKTILLKDGNYLGELKVSEEHVNAAKILHGGLISALIDNFNCAALQTHKECLRLTNVTISMHISYLKAAKLNDIIVIDARTIKTGRTLGHVQCEIRNKNSSEILSKGKSTMVIVRSKL